MNTDCDGDGNYMFSTYGVAWPVRYRKLLKLIVVYKTFAIMALSQVLCQVISLDKRKTTLVTADVYFAENDVRCIV